MPRTPAPRTTHARAAPATRAFLFADLRDYTTFVETHGDAAAARLLKDYRTLVRREVARFKGAEVKTEGDSFYVVFDSASAALDCAVAIARKVKARNEKEADRPLKVGIGIHAGETIAFDKQFVGSAVNVASRLASKAEAAQIIVSDTLRGLVRTGHPYQMIDRGGLQLKGVSEAIRAWSIELSEATSGPDVTLPPSPPRHITPAGEQVLCPIVIGREPETAQAEKALEAAASGRGQTIVVAGEAGGGKSAFAREVESRARARGFRVLLGATLESDRTLPYAPFVAAVRSGFRGIDRDRLGRVLAQTAPDLAQLFPELGRASRTDGAIGEQHRLTVAFHGLFTAFAREAPILIVLEDLHWSDEASLDLLHYLARELRDSRAVLLATYRSDEMHRRHPFLRTLSSLQRERLINEVNLGRLSREEVGALILATFRATDPSVTVSNEFRDAIFARSEGNPFFTEELLKALVESGDVYFTAERGWDRKPMEQLRIPTSIREAVHARIERLSPEAQATLSAAAVIGLRFPFDVLRGTSGASAADVLAHLRQLIDLQLVVEIGGEDDAYAFRHALTQEVVHDELLAPERKALHRAVVEVLIGRERTEPSLVAHHLVAAGDNARAVPYLVEAARRAMVAEAPREAAAHYERALEIGVSGDELAGVLEQLARAYERFDITRCRRAAEQALALYRKDEDRRGISRVLLVLAHVGNLYAEERTRALVDEAVSVVEGLGDTAELAHALVRQSYRVAERGVVADTRAFAERLLALGVRLDDPRTLTAAYVLRCGALLNERPEEALREVARGREIAIEAGLADAAMNAYFATVWAMTYLRRPAAEILATIDEGLAYGRRHGIEQTPLIPMRGYYHVNHGEWDEALASVVGIDPSWYDNAVEIRARIAEGRQGPEAAVPLHREHARAWRALTGAPTAPGLVSAAYAELLAGDRGASQAALDALREIAPNAWHVSYFLSRLLLAATLVDRPEWIDLVEPVLARGEWTGMRAGALACRAARAFRAGDIAECGRLLSEMRRLDPPPAEFGIDTAGVDLIVGLARAARSRGQTIGPEWKDALGTVRTFAESAKAIWWLEQIDLAETESARA